MALTKIQGGVVKDTSQLSITSVNATGVVTAASFVGSGAGLTGITGGASQVYDSTVFAYQNVIQSNITVSSPYKTATIYTDPNTTVDIDSGYQISVDSGCVLNIIDI
jgi:hypothetical protein